MNLTFDGNRLTFNAAYLIYNEPPVLADFSLSVDTVIIGDSLQVINKSSRADSFVWKSNGTTVSNAREVSIDTNRPIGTYTLALTATRDGQTSTKTKTFNVIADPVKPSDVSGLIVSADLQITSPPATDNKGIAGYITQRKINNDDWAALSSPALTFTDREELPDYATPLSYRRKAIDTSGNLSENWSNIATFAYQPLKAIISVSGFSGTVTISAILSGTIAPVGARFAVDGQPIGGEDLTAPYSVTFDTTTIANGGHTFGVLGRNNEGWTELETIVVNVYNALSGIGPLFIWDEVQRPESTIDPYFPEYPNRTHKYEDESASYNELGDTPALVWIWTYAPIDRDTQGELFMTHYNAYRTTRGFQIQDKKGDIYSDVHYQSPPEVTYPLGAHLSDTWRVKVTFVKNP